MQHVVVIAYSTYLILIYLVREPYFLYPGVALMLTVVWESAGWSGMASFVTMGTVLALFLLAVLGRLLFRKALLISKPANETLSIVLTMMGFFLFVLVLGSVLYVL